MYGLHSIGGYLPSMDGGIRQLNATHTDACIMQEHKSPLRSFYGLKRDESLFGY